MSLRRRYIYEVVVEGNAEEEVRGLRQEVNQLSTNTGTATTQTRGLGAGVNGLSGSMITGALSASIFGIGIAGAVASIGGLLASTGTGSQAILELQTAWFNLRRELSEALSLPEGLERFADLLGGITTGLVSVIRFTNNLDETLSGQRAVRQNENLIRSIPGVGDFLFRLLNQEFNILNSGPRSSPNTGGSASPPVITPSSAVPRSLLPGPAVPRSLLPSPAPSQPTASAGGGVIVQNTFNGPVYGEAGLDERIQQLVTRVFSNPNIRRQVIGA